jgi:uncharacterized protein YdhG (YjbR/CyaY superfamily)
VAAAGLARLRRLLWGGSFFTHANKGGKMKEKTITTIDEYIEQSPENIQQALKNIRKVIKESAPNAGERISYKMPAFYLEGNLVYFAAFKNHIGFYPVPSGINKFEQELSVYKQGKGSIQFPLDQPIPYKLISKIVKYRVKENLEKAKAKLSKRKKK